MELKMSLNFFTISCILFISSSLKSCSVLACLETKFPNKLNSRIKIISMVHNFQEDFQRLETSYQAQRLNTLTSKSELETNKVLLVVDKLEKLKMNEIISKSTVQKLVLSLAHTLPFSLISRFANEDYPSADSLISYVSQIYHNMDVGLIVSSLIERGFVTPDDDTINRLKISIVLIALFKMKDIYTISPIDSNYKSKKMESYPNPMISLWAS